MLWIRLGLAVAMIASGEARAAQNGHEALFAAPVGKSRIVVRDLLWQCDGSRCAAPARATAALSSSVWRWPTTLDRSLNFRRAA